MSSIPRRHPLPRRGLPDKRPYIVIGLHEVFLPEANPDFKSVSAAFYASRYDEPQPEHIRPDYRPTLLWVPRIRTGADGVATFLFYTSDAKSTANIQVEGLALSGLPGFGQARVVVEL